MSLADEKWGEIVQAVVTTRAPVRDVDLDEYMKGQVASYKRPRGYCIWDALPKSAAGKIIRRAVRDELRAQKATAATDPVR